MPDVPMPEHLEQVVENKKDQRNAVGLIPSCFHTGTQSYRPLRKSSHRRYGKFVSDLSETGSSCNSLSATQSLFWSF